MSVLDTEAESITFLSTEEFKNDEAHNRPNLQQLIDENESKQRDKQVISFSEAQITEPTFISKEVQSIRIRCEIAYGLKNCNVNSCCH